MPPLLRDGNVTRDIQFPVLGGHWLGSGWNDLRDKATRYHHGVDVIANPGQPVISPVNGTLVKIVRGHPTIDNGIVVVDADGYEWHLYHLSASFPSALAAGSAVVAGQLVGFIGSDQAIPHLHAELHQPDGTPINSLWSLQSGRSGNLPCADVSEVTAEWRAVYGLVISPDNNSYFAIDSSMCDPSTVTVIVGG
jgi:murein DD-endopeptidase MepM/ murein hydrolase activator NlpD